MNYNKENFNILSNTVKPKHLIGLEYFNNDGNFIKFGEYSTEKEWMFEVIDEVEMLMNNDKLPNLKNIRNINLYIDSCNHPKGFPSMTGYNLNDLDICLNNTKEENLTSNKVTLEYFKESFKFYTDTEIEVDKDNINSLDLVKMVYKFKEEDKKLPGVTHGEFHVYIKCGNFRKLLPIR